MTAFSPSVASSNWLLRELARWPKTLKIGAGLMLLIVLAGAFAPLLTPYDPQSIMNYCNTSWNNGGKLSALDQVAVAKLYGTP